VTSLDPRLVRVHCGFPCSIHVSANPVTAAKRPAGVSTFACQMPGYIWVRKGRKPPSSQRKAQQASAGSERTLYLSRQTDECQEKGSPSVTAAFNSQLWWKDASSTTFIVSIHSQVYRCGHGVPAAQCSTDHVLFPVPYSLTARDDQDRGAFPSPTLHVLEVALEERQIMMRQSASTALISLAYLTTHITGRRGGLPVWSSPPCPASGIAPTCHSLPLTLYLSSDTADGRRPSLEWLLPAIPANHKSQLTMQGPSC